MKKLAWISRHEMTPEQFSDLERAMGDTLEVYPWRDTVRDTAVLAPLISACDVVAVVLPPELLAAVLALAGEKPVVHAVSARVPTGKILTLPDGRREAEFAFVHQRWEQILEARFVTRRL